MNLSTIKLGATRAFGLSALTLKQNSPEILLGLGLVGGVGAAIFAAKATLKAEAILDHHHHMIDSINIVSSSPDRPEQYDQEEELKDRAMAVVKTGLEFAKLYGPSLALGFASIAAILASHGIMKNRQASLVAAYSVLAEAFAAYRKNVTDELGVEFDSKYIESAVKERDLSFPENKKKKQEKVERWMPGPYSRIYDESNPNFRGSRKHDKAFLINEQNLANNMLNINGHVFLNDIYKRLGFPETMEGQIVGWFITGRTAEELKAEGKDYFIDFGLTNPMNGPGKEFWNGTNDSVMLNFNPHGIVFDQLRSDMIKKAIKSGNLFDPIKLDPDDFVAH